MPSAIIMYDVIEVKILGPVVQNLTKLLANVKLKFVPWNMAYTLISFSVKSVKATHIFAAKLSMYLKLHYLQ